MRTSPISFFTGLTAALGALAPSADAQCPAWQPGGGLTGANAPVRAAHSFDDGAGPALFIGGSFTAAGTASASFAARWTGSDWEALGSGPQVDVWSLTAFDFGAGLELIAGSSGAVERWDGSTWSSVGGSFNGVVNELVEYQGALYAGGNFTQAGGSAAAFLARWNGTSWADVAGGLDGIVQSLAVFDDGAGAQLVVGGNFSNAGGLPAHRIARWDGTSWSALPTFSDGGFRALAVHDDGAGARLCAATTMPTPSGLEFHVVRLDAGAWTSLARFGGQVSALASHDDGTGPALVAGGIFGNLTPAGGSALPIANVARLRNATWEALPELANGFTTDVMALVRHPVPSGTRLFAGGRFQQASGTSALHVAQWTGSAWQATSGAGSLTADVNDLALFDAGQGRQVFAAQNDALQRWDGSAWSTVSGAPSGLRNLATGALGSGGAQLLFAGASSMSVSAWDGAAWTDLSALGPGVSGIGAPSALAVLDDGSGAGGALYLGGWFALGSQPETYRIARCDGTAWSELGTADGFPYSFAVHDDGNGPKLYAGGGFLNVGGVNSGSVARFNGFAWEAFSVPSVLFDVYSLRVHDDGGGAELYAGGQLTSSAGDHILRRSSGAWSLVGAGLDGQVEDLVEFDDGGARALYAVGTFGTSGGTPMARIARWDGASWSALGAGLSSTAHALVAASDRFSGAPELFAGGSFATAGGLASNKVARWRGCSFDTFCAGDGLDPQVVACPCGNLGSAGHGCANSLHAGGAVLGASGAPIVAADTLTLTASQLTGSFALFFQGSAPEQSLPGSTTGVVLGDGVRCVGGSIRRLGTRLSSGGVASLGHSAGGPALSLVGQIPPAGGTAYYQAWYRNATSFCTGATFNLTNGVRALWSP